jgi:putative nucleotidyltransferase with HDIG domain
MQAKRLTIFYKLRNIYETSGKALYTIGEPLTILQHSIECGRFRLKTNNSALIVAGLLHDIGHLKPDIPIDPNTGINDKHEYIGGSMLAEMGFPDNIVEPIRNHVNAKRYLCYKNPIINGKTYLESLSLGSIASMKIQGGVMGKKEANEFEKNKWFKESIELRYADEAAKEIKIPQMTFSDFKEYIIDVLH